MKSSAAAMVGCPSTPRCVANCSATLAGLHIYPCGPSHPLCFVAPKKPTFAFHLADPTCVINDPNGPFYDPVHRLYHTFYQIHVAEDQGGAGSGPVWGHWVSTDLLHWAQLPVAIWNDRFYDNVAVFTGSTTIVGGKPVIVYPGQCSGYGRKGPVCNDAGSGYGGFTYAMAVPKNESDPLYREWSKEGSIGGKRFSNPILNHTGDDPSTAWRTAAGEWRLLGNDGCQLEMNTEMNTLLTEESSAEEAAEGTPLYGSMDFVSWYKIGCTPMMAGDCPSLFPLPSLTPGSEDYIDRHLNDAPMPTHVHKSGGARGDQMQVLALALTPTLALTQTLDLALALTPTLTLTPRWVCGWTGRP